MRPKFFALLLSLVVLAALPAAASAAAQVGISENNPQMFSDPNFQALGVSSTRLVVAYNAVPAQLDGDDEISTRVGPYIAAANAAGIEPLIAFEHARGAAEICNKKSNYKKSVCRLPTATEYENAIRAFLRAYPTVKVFAPWNEANHFTQPTSRNPKAAAKFTDIATKVCKELGRKCTIVAADLLDQADSAAAKRPTYKSTTRWIKTFRKALKSKRSVCGIHNYSDVNRFRTTGTTALIKALGCKQYWLTETGGLYDFASFWGKSARKAGKCSSATACQLKATKYLFSLVRKQRKIKRVYVYTWYGGAQPRFDAGIVKGRPGEPTTPRKAYSEVKKHT
jgi:hypothetical protein